MTWKNGAAHVLARPKKQALHWRIHLFFSFTSTAQLFQCWHLEALIAGRCVQTATIPAVKAVFRAAPSIATCLASWMFLCFYVAQ
jgi:hypothetical protein